MTPVNDIFWEVLIGAGVDHVFGIPGGGMIPLWKAFRLKTE